MVNVTLFKADGVYYTYNNGWVSLDITTPSEQTFLEHGIEDVSTVPLSAFDYLVRPLEVLTYTEKNISVPIEMSLNDTEIYWAIKINDTLYTYIDNSWALISESEIFSKGMSKAELESITDFSGVFEEGSISLVGAAKSNDSEVTWWVEKVEVELPDSFNRGSTIITCPQFNTLDWEVINSIEVTQTVDNESDIRYAFSFDNKNTWKVYDLNELAWKEISDIFNEGMVKTEVESIANLPFNNATLDVIIGISNTDAGSSPSISQISVKYTPVDSPMVSNTITVPVPMAGFRNVLIDDTYTLKLAEGIAFDDADIDYDFYTTPNKIKLRPLNMGEITGGRYSNIYAVEIINGYEEEDFNIILYASKGGQDAEPKGSYGLFHDSEREASRTRIELSLVGEEGFNPTYPLTFKMNRNSSRIFYIRIKPTLTTAGYDTFQIRLIGRAV